MSSFTYYYNNPQASENPSNSQGLILQNFTSLGRPAGSGGSWTTQDHYGFGTGTDGQHQFIRLPANVDSGSATGLVSSILSKTGTALSSASQLFYRSSQGDFLLSGIRAYGSFTVSSGGTLTTLQAVNSSVTRSSVGTYAVTINASIVNGTSYGVILSCGRRADAPTTDSMIVNYLLNSATSVTIYSIDPVKNVAADTVSCTYIIYQI